MFVFMYIYIKYILYVYYTCGTIIYGTGREALRRGFIDSAMCHGQREGWKYKKIENVAQIENSCGTFKRAQTFKWVHGCTVTCM